MTIATFPLNDGHAIPALGLGTWKSADDDAYRAVKEALRVGYQHIDGAWIYGNEEQVGRALAESVAEGVVAREDVFVTTKLWNCFHRPEDVEKGCRESLAKLGLEQVDLYLVHWPIAFRPGVIMPEDEEGFLPLSEAPLAATWEAMLALREKGLAKSVGVSNVSPSTLRQLVADTGVAPAVNQVELHPYNPQPELMATCAELGVHLTAYSPLGSMDRPPTRKGEDEPPLLKSPKVAAVADAEGLTPAQLLIAWAIARGTSVIPKSTNAGRIAENFAAGEATPGADALAALDAIETRYRYVNPSSLLRPGITHDGDFWA